jgi:hypothetical protein
MRSVESEEFADCARATAGKHNIARHTDNREYFISHSILDEAPRLRSLRLQSDLGPDRRIR